VQHAGQLLGSISLSIGVSLYPQHGSVTPEIIRVADEALYRAKHDGRDRVMVAGVTNAVQS
jgi:diguanylate cyclase (GGDEF)-like protein